MCRTISSVAWIAIFLLAILSPLWGQTQASTDSEKAINSKPILKVGGDVSAPQVVYDPEPEYSEEARKAHFSGSCVLALVVDPDGSPRNIMVIKTLGMGLDEQAIAAVRQWRFRPAMKNGVPVSVKVSVQVVFHLFGNPPPPKYDNLIAQADVGDAKSQFELSQLFLSDRADMKDEYRGLDYLKKSATQGFPKAQFAMGEYVLAHGSDLPTAYVWFARAEKNHIKHRDQKMKELAGKMTPEQLADAQKRVDSNGP
jgi:TonB family protein